MLAARVQESNKTYSYILKSPEFCGVTPATYDLLKYLTVGEISILYEYALAYNDKAKRKIDGQFFTPDDVSRFLANHESKFSSSTVWVDPCSGVGNLSYWMIRRQKNPEKFLLKRIFLVDLDPLALLTARVFFTLEFQKQEATLFNNLDTRFLVRDFLTANDLPKFDAAILNPPYVSGVFHTAFRTAQTKNMYAYFLERVATLCPAGYISITPQTFTNGSRFRSLRDVLLEYHKTIDVYCFDNVPDNIFSGIKFGSDNSNKANSTRAGIIIARHTDKQRHRITPLLRWRSHERIQLLASAEQFLTEVTFSADLFHKVSKELKSLYETVRDFKQTLGDLVVSAPSPYELQVPTTPRYYISANKRPVRRTSYKTLYFASAHDRDRVYVILNSSYMYWWWRVQDGGMTISDRTLLGLPIPTLTNLVVAKQFVKKLEISERSSLVIKMNAGKPIENIKHPQDLINSITAFLFPKYANLLSNTHSNSHLSSKKVILQPQLIS